MNEEEKILEDDRNQRLLDDYYESLEEDDELELKTCKGDMCMNYEDDEDYHLCNECKRVLQNCFSEWISQFNKEEKEYLIDYIKEREVI